MELPCDSKDSYPAPLHVQCDGPGEAARVVVVSRVTTGSTNDISDPAQGTDHTPAADPIESADTCPVHSEWKSRLLMVSAND
jgi:hypothetical protein